MTRSTLTEREPAPASRAPVGEEPEDAEGKKPGGSTLFALLVFGIPLVLLVLLGFLLRD